MRDSPYSTRAAKNCAAFAIHPHRRIRSPTIPSSASSTLRNGDTLVGTASGLDRLTAANLDITRIALPAELLSTGQPLFVRALTETPDGMVWVGTDQGLARLDPRNDRWRVFREPSGQAPGRNTALPDNRIRSLLIDSQGRLWVGTIRGLSWFDSASEIFSSYRRDEAEIRSLPDDYIVSLAEDRGGSLWIGTKFGGLAKWNPRTWSFGHVRASAEEGYSDRNITSFAEDKLGRLWIGTFGSGINLLDRSTGRVTPVRHMNGVRTSLSDERVMAMLESSAGDIWVGTMGGGLNRFDPQTLKRRDLPARPRGSHLARRSGRDEPARGRQTTLGRHVRWRHLAVRCAHAPLRKPAPGPRRRPASLQRTSDRAGPRSRRPCLDRHRWRRSQRLGPEDPPPLLLQARRQAARHAERRHYLFDPGR